MARVEGDWDWEGGEQEYRKANELDHGYATAHQWYSGLLVPLGRTDEGIEHALEAVRRDPLSFILYGTAGDALYYARRWEEAVEMYHRGIELAPSFGQLRMDLARTYELSGRLDDAIKQYLRALDLMRGDPSRAPGLACVYVLAGRRNEAERILEGMRTHAREAWVPPYAFASVLTRLGRTEEALAELERAYGVRDRAMVNLRVNPRFDPLRDDPRFVDLVRRMRLSS
jgi:tetratricopeptide (TPR) repeat protein